FDNMTSPGRWLRRHCVTAAAAATSPDRHALVVDNLAHARPYDFVIRSHVQPAPSVQRLHEPCEPCQRFPQGNGSRHVQICALSLEHGVRVLVHFEYKIPCDPTWPFIPLLFEYNAMTAVHSRTNLDVHHLVLMDHFTPLALCTGLQYNLTLTVT